MKKLILFLLLTYSNQIFATLPSVIEVRNLYQKAAVESKSCTKIIALLRTYDETNNTLMGGYKACAKMMMANYVINPYSKLSNFKEGKTLLEKCIKADYKNTELRFLRFSIQTKAPSFLGYNNFINSDKKYLINSLSSITDAALKEIIITFLKLSEHLSLSEKLKLNK